MARSGESTDVKVRAAPASGSTAEEAMTFIGVRNLSFAYKQFSLKSISFQVRLGEFTTVLGSNGSGKSTLLKLMSGFLKPHTGTVLLRGLDIHQMTLQQRARQIALVAQESHLNFSMTVREFVLMGRHPHLSWFKFEDRHSLEILRWALEMTDSQSLAHRNIQELSGGEKQRVVLARALVQEPQLMLLDEPTMHLDVGYQVELVHLIKSLSRDKGFTVVMVTHELNIAAEFSDQVLLLNEGNALAFGPPASVLDETNLMKVFRTDLLVDRNPISGAPRITPVGKGKR